MSYGEIYSIKCKTSGKYYIGQCKKYQGKYHDKWGYLKRWSSHIYEALKSNNDHCSYLNNAIRKYGYDDFIIEKIDETYDQIELDKLEKFYIKKYNSFVPNGYNLDSGGKNGYIVSDETKQKQSKNRLGMRKNKPERKYSEDNILPKYIVAVRNKNGVIEAYKILNFPIGINEPEYISKYFYLSKKKNITKQDAYDNAIEYLNELKKDYFFISKNKTYDENGFSDSDEDEIKPIPSKKTERKKHQYPPYIEPIYTNDDRRLLIGYCVDGPKYPKKEFTGKTNRWNLNSAKKYILKIDIQNADEIFEIPPLPDDLPKTRLRKNINDNKLPKYMFSIKDDENIKGIKGFSLKINKIIDENGKSLSKTYSNPEKTLEQKYIECINELRNQLKIHNINN